MKHKPRMPAAAMLGLVAVFLIACGGTSTRVSKTFYDEEYKGRRFGNILVIAAADDYDARAHFERNVASAIRRNGAEATAYYTVIGHNPPITVSDITNAVRSRGFDAVLFTRVKGSAQQVKVKDGAASGQAVVKGGNVFDLFRYDYEEYNEPENVRVSTNVILLTELYDAQTQKKIWAVESSSFDRESVEQIVESAAESVVKALNRDRLIGPR